MSHRITFNQAWSGEANCQHCTLRASVLFSGLSQTDFEHIHDPISQYILTPGTTLYRAGDNGRYLFTIRSGLIKQLRVLPDGTQRILRLVRSTDILGLETLVVDTYQHDAVALQTTELCSFPARMVRQLGENHPTLRYELMRRWQMALHEADAWIIELSTGSSRARIARLLLRLAAVDPKNPTCELVSREDMGAMLGITTETASRTIAEFKRQGLVRDTQSNQFLLDIPKLQRVALD